MRTGRRKAIVGIEAAIVLIAFVIVAAALAFVALNMGLFTTQKSKETIGRGLSEASSALEVDGAVTGNVSNSAVTGIVIPLKISPGREAVDFSADKTTVRLIVGDTAYEDIYSGVTSYTGPYDVASLMNTVNGSSAKATVIFIRGDGDNVLEFGEKALLVINLGTSAGPYTTITVEVRPPEGAPLTVGRMVPPSLPTSGAVDMG